MFTLSTLILTQAHSRLRRYMALGAEKIYKTTTGKRQ